MYLELHLAFFQVFEKKSRIQPDGSNKANQMSRKKNFMQTDQRSIKKALTRKGCPTFQRRRRDMRTAFCERQLKYNVLCCMEALGKHWAAAPGGRSGQVQEFLVEATRSRMSEKAARGTPSPPD